MKSKPDKDEFPESISDKADNASLSPFEIATFILSIYVLSALLVEATIPLSKEASRLLSQIDYWVYFVFLAEFFSTYFGRLPKEPFSAGAGLT